MDKDSQSKEKILELGFETITQNGVRFFTVESLAAHLGMSKKTIYKYFPSKDILIEKIFDYFTSVIKRKLNQIVNSDMDPVEKYYKIMDFIMSKVSKMSMGKLVEVQNRHPIIWKKFELFRKGLTQDFATIFIEAQEKGYARKDIDMNIVAIIYMNIVNSTFQPEFFFQNNLAPIDTIKLFMQMITEGIFIKPEVKKLNNKLIWES
jgi:TetR/AcrR family transcriptional regulator, cholesterol catabolism regulator